MAKRIYDVKKLRAKPAKKKKKKKKMTQKMRAKIRGMGAAGNFPGSK